MAHMTESELIVLKARALAAQVSGAHLAHAEAHIMALVDEVMALRGGKKSAKPAAAAVLEAAKAVGMSVKTATSVGELADQLSKDLRGEKDEHDLVVDKIEAETVKRAEAAAEEVKASKDSKKKGK